LFVGVRGIKFFKAKLIASNKWPKLLIVMWRKEYNIYRLTGLPGNKRPALAAIIVMAPLFQQVGRTYWLDQIVGHDTLASYFDPPSATIKQSIDKFGVFGAHIYSR